MLTKDGFTLRQVTSIDFSKPQKIVLPEVYQPQSCIINIDVREVDIGSYCYATRKVDRNGKVCSALKNKQGFRVIPVDLDSFDTKRVALTKKLLEFAAEQAKSMSLVTVCNQLRNLGLFFQFYFNQPDLDFSNPENRLHYAEAARRYSALLGPKHDIGSAQKHRLTASVYVFAQYLFDDVELNDFDYEVIPDVDQAKQCTAPLLSEEHDLASALRVAIFEGIHDLLINDKPFPFPLSVPPQCGELNDRIWLGYSPWNGPTTFPRSKDFRKSSPTEWFNRETGKLLTKTEWHESAEGLTPKQRNDQWANIQKRLEKTNKKHSNLRRLLAGQAGASFFDLLLSMTGMNQQPALGLPWYGSYFVQKVRQGHKTITLLKPEDGEKLKQLDKGKVFTYLRSIKNRKNYQPVEVIVSNSFSPKFERYLQIRDYYLKGGYDARLFPFKPAFVTARRSYLFQVFPEIPKLTAHIAKASVADEVLSTTSDLHLAAEILQNDLKTVIKHYAAGTRKSHIQGIGGFFNELGDQIKKTRQVANNEIQTAAGGCENNGNQPEPLPSAPIEPDCTTQEGCFFCKSYCVHTDATDIRKLFSILYYINYSATRAQNTDFFDQTFGLVISRIKDLLEQIKAISDEKHALVERIKDEVFNHEELDHYWLQKLNRLEALTGDS